MEPEDPSYITDSSVLLPPRTSGKSRQSRQSRQSKQSRQGKHAKKIEAQEALESLEMLQPDEFSKSDAFLMPKRQEEMEKRELYKTKRSYSHNQNESRDSRSQRELQNSFNQFDPSFVPSNQNDAAQPPRRDAESFLPQKTQDKEEKREHLPDYVPFATLSKSGPEPLEEPMYVVNLL